VASTRTGDEGVRICKELVQRVRDEVGAVASLKQVDIVAGLPKTRSGKILRKTMRELADGKVPTVPGHDRGRVGARRARTGAAPRRLIGGGLAHPPR
jgi:acyl-CoA synthetase (AMP-forming)/AMP-acid ligase II